MKQLLFARHFRLKRAIPGIARLALFALVVQLSSLGHWSIGPFHADSGSASEHAMHCHGDTSGCGGQPSLVGTLAGISLTPLPPVSLALAIEASSAAPAETALEVLNTPPRA